ncbi:Longitudinals lacking protein, isoforms A/B/D/L [Frankliniella fusca]|uniref:Longitudinals lacking protein, isoforms A/B/D/L n=1 Tax=Frankliniella fusca TaxID=407009 RepID=A0AAE1H630_9NEOP|nr:Longitudinals lacking protein, isoforms A/B/D/L [Frankliniella fusca]
MPDSTFNFQNVFCMVISTLLWSPSIRTAGAETFYEEGIFNHQQPIQQWHEDLQPIINPRSSNNSSNKNFPCPTCGKVYLRSRSLWRHRNYECGKDPQFQCPYCNHQTKQKSSLKVHILRLHSHTQQPKRNENLQSLFIKNEPQDSIDIPDQAIDPSTAKNGQYHCPECGKTFGDYHVLWNHLDFVCNKSNDFQ